MERLNEAIIAQVRQKQRGRKERGVFPHELVGWLDEPYHEFTIRRRMVALWERGELIRIGGEGARRGYRVPTVVERVCLALYGEA